MKITRRQTITGIAAGTGAALIGLRVQAELAMGDAVLTTLSDGNLVLPRDFLLGPVPAADAAPILARYGISGDTLSPPCNVTLLRSGSRMVLFDSGAGSGFQPSAGALADSLAALGVDPGEVTDVVFTHAHPDHLWGVLDDFDDPTFYNARHLMGRAERDYWLDPATVDTIGADRQSFAVGAARRLETLGDRLETFTDGAELLPGVAARSAPGHTPGHMAFEIALGGTRAMVLGDAVTNHFIGFERPDWPSGSDHDHAEGARTRAALLAELADSDTVIIGFHLPDGGMGRAESSGAGYRFVALDG